MFAFLESGIILLFVCLSSQAKIRLPGHPWSSKFSLDAVGDSGKVTCKGSDSKRFEVR